MTKLARTKAILRYSAFGAIGSAMALSPLGFAGADPNAPVPPPPATVTATVTAIVAPDQCKPLPDGKLPQRAVDYATDGGPIQTPAPSGPPNDRMSGGDEAPPPAAPASGEMHGSGPFDPYTCEVQGATPATTTPVNAEPKGPKLEDIPGVKPTLRPYPGQGPGGMAESPQGGSGVNLGPANPKAAPTDVPAPAPAPGAAPGPSNPLG